MDQAGGPVAWTAIDWDAPWFKSWREPGESIAHRVAGGEPLHEALNTSGRAPVRFVEQSLLPDGAAYEHYIRASGNCPVRPGLHDFFNGLCWIALPLSKARLNELQAAQIGAQGVGAVRGPVRDAITLFDESGALLDAPAELWTALLDRNWQRLFVELRPLWSQAKVLIVGHALLEKLTAPRKPLTAHVWAAPMRFGSVPQADALLAAQLTTGMLVRKPFTPLPVLGIPGWCAGNQELSFYDDAQVFRNRRPAN